MNLAQYIPALEWLGLNPRFARPGWPVMIGAPEMTGLHEDGSDYDNAQAIILILDAIEARGDAGGLYKPMVFKRDTDDYECAFAGAYFKYGSYVGPTRTIAVLEAAKAVHEKEKGNG